MNQGFKANSMTSIIEQQLERKSGKSKLLGQNERTITNGYGDKGSSLFASKDQLILGGLDTLPGCSNCRIDHEGFFCREYH